MGEKFDGQNQPFPATRWTLIARAGRDTEHIKHSAVTELLSLYLSALRVHLQRFVRRHGLRPEQVDDLLQGFLMAKVLEGQIIDRADQAKGKFRTFLCTAMDNFVRNSIRDQNAAVRSPGDLVQLDEHIDTAAPDHLPEESFDIAWARQLLAEAVDRMRLECTSIARADIWGVFEGQVLVPTLGEGVPIPYDELVSRYGFASPSQASNVLVTAKRMFKRKLREVISEYETDEAAIDAEIADLREILRRRR
jgi:RNA polymerase sigma-70 factor (ECF subfamily)